MFDNERNMIVTSNNLKLHPRMKDFYKFFKYNGKVVDIIDYDEDLLNIFSRSILQQIRKGEAGWEKTLPEGIAKMIKDKGMFDYKSSQLS